MKSGEPVTQNDSYLEYLARRNQSSGSAPLVGHATTTSSSTPVALLTVPVPDNAASLIKIDVIGWDATSPGAAGYQSSIHEVSRTGGFVTVVDSSTLAGGANVSHGATLDNTGVKFSITGTGTDTERWTAQATVISAT